MEAMVDSLILLVMMIFFLAGGVWILERPLPGIRCASKARDLVGCVAERSIHLGPPFEKLDQVVKALGLGEDSLQVVVGLKVGVVDIEDLIQVPDGLINRFALLHGELRELEENRDAVGIGLRQVETTDQRLLDRQPILARDVHALQRHEGIQ